MISDIWTVMRKEFREIFLMRGSVRGNSGRMLIFVAILGVFMPYTMGKAWVQSPFVVLYSLWFPMMVVSSIVSDSFAGERERHTLETLLASRLPDASILLGKVFAVVLYAWGMIVAMLLAGLATVNIAHGHGKLLMYPSAIGLGSAGIGLLASLLAANLGALISLRASTVKQAQQTLAYISIFTFLIPMLSIQIIPDTMRTRFMMWVTQVTVAGLITDGVVILVALDAVLFGLATLRFRRAKLILD